MTKELNVYHFLSATSRLVSTTWGVARGEWRVAEKRSLSYSDLEVIVLSSLAQFVLFAHDNRLCAIIELGAQSCSVLRNRSCLDGRPTQRDCCVGIG